MNLPKHCYLEEFWSGNKAYPKSALFGGNTNHYKDCTYRVRVIYDERLAKLTGNWGRPWFLNNTREVVTNLKGAIGKYNELKRTNAITNS